MSTYYICKRGTRKNIFDKDVIEQFLTDEGIRYKILSHMSEICCPSPFVKDRATRCYINYEKGLYHDFLSGKSGDFVSFVQDTKGFTSYGEAKFFIIKNYFDGTIEDLLEEKEEVEVEEEALFVPPSFEILNTSDTNHDRFINYLAERDLEDIVGKVNLLCDPLDNRIVFPFYEHGEMIYWTARSIEQNPYLRWKNAVGNRSNLVFNIDNITLGSTVYIFEGIMDALMVYPKGVAILGSSISQEQIVRIGSRQPKRIVVVMDSDVYGLAAQQVIADRFLDYEFDVHVFDWSKIEGAKDFNEMGKELVNLALKYTLPWNRKTETLLKLRNI